MPRISQQREEATRRRILSAAAESFIEKGFHEAGIDDVVRASGLSVGAIYTYFRSKDELIGAVCLQAIDDGIDQVMVDLSHARTIEEKVLLTIDAWFGSFDTHPGLTLFLVQAWAAAAEMPSIREMLIRRRERMVTIGAMLLRQGIEGGEVRSDIDIERVARGFTVLFDGFALERLERSSAGRAGFGQDGDHPRKEVMAFFALLRPPTA